MARARFPEQYATYHAEWRADGLCYGRGARRVSTSGEAFGVALTIPSGRTLALKRQPLHVPADAMPQRVRAIIATLERALPAGPVHAVIPALSAYTVRLGKGNRGGGFHRGWARPDR